MKLNNEPFSAHQKLRPEPTRTSRQNYAQFSGKEYAPDRINERRGDFLRDNKDRPFFLYYPTTVPHLALQVPEDSLAEYKDAFPEDALHG